MKVMIRVKEVVLLGSGMGGLGCRANCGGEPCAVLLWGLLPHTARYRITRTDTLGGGKSQVWDENGLLLPLPNTGMAFVGWSPRRAGDSDVDMEHLGGRCSLPLSAEQTPAPLISLNQGLSLGEVFRYCLNSTDKASIDLLERLSGRETHTVKHRSH